MRKNNRMRMEFMADIDRSKATGKKLVHTDQEYDIPFFSKAIFWPVRYPVASPLLHRLPFLFWLMETSRPQKVLQIGLGDGLVYMAICQAAERLGGQTLCLGIDPGDSPLPVSLRAQHDEQFSDISTLLPTGIPPGGGRLVKGVDILVLNARLSDEQSQIVLKNWLPQLSKRAVVLTCDPIRVHGSANLHQELLDETKYPILAGPMSPGGDLLDVTLYGPNQPERLLRLADSNDDSSVQMAARQVFGRLGQGIVDAWELNILKSESAISVQRVDNLQKKTAYLEQALVDARRQTDMLHKTVVVEPTRIEVTASSELPNASAWRKGKSALAARVIELEELLNTSQKESRLAVECIRKHNSAVEEEHATRVEDIAVLMQYNKRHLDELKKIHQRELEILRLKQAESTLKIEEIRSRSLATEAQLTARINTLSNEKTIINDQHDARMKSVYNSTSWRVTRPLRSLKLALKRFRPT